MVKGACFSRLPLASVLRFALLLSCVWAYFFLAFGLASVLRLGLVEACDGRGLCVSCIS